MQKRPLIFSRLWKEVNGTKRYFLYSDEGLIAEYDENGEEYKTYGFIPESIWCTDPIILKENMSFYIFQNDHIGKSIKSSSTNDGVVWEIIGNVFNNIRHNHKVANNIIGSGQYADLEVCLNYNYFRYYNTKTARYYSVDPINSTKMQNKYIYANNNPIIYIDPYGLYSFNFGAYYGVGADMSFASSECCKGTKIVKSRYLTFCVGVGLGGKIKGTSVPLSFSGPLSKAISSFGNTCPKTGDMFLAKSATFAFVVGGTGEVEAGNRGLSARIKSVIGIGASYEIIKVCGIIVWSEKTLKEGCCREAGKRYGDLPWQSE